MSFTLRVRCSTGENVPLLNFSSQETTLSELYGKLATLLKTEEKNLKILSGFPPKPLKGSKSSKLVRLGVRNNEVIYLHDRTSSDPPQYEVETEDNKTAVLTSPSPTVTAIDVPVKSASSFCESKRVAESPPHNDRSTKRSATVSDNKPTVKPGIFMDAGCDVGKLKQFVVPSDNSCLFASVDFILNGGTDPSRTQDLRTLAADTVLTDPSVMNYLVDQTPQEYSDWVRRQDKWGGDIELSMFSKYYAMEIVTINVKTGHIHRFGESEAYDVRVFLMYDGIHYDPMSMPAPGLEGFFYTSFPGLDSSILDQSCALAIEGHESGKFTDTQKFTLECGQCGLKMRGEDEALKHAKETSHTAFEEVKKEAS